MSTGQGKKTIVCMVVLVGVCTGTSSSAEITLEDRNSSVVIDPNSSAGMKSWIIDTIPYLKQQWLWYRIGNEETDREYSIDTIDADPVVGASDLNWRPGLDTLYVQYDGPDFQIKLVYMLWGGPDGSGESDVSESISVINTSDDALDFHIFQYCDFDLHGSVDDDRVEIIGGNTARQQDDEGYYLYQSECVEVPRASRYQVADDQTVINSLNDGTKTVLNNTAVLAPPGGADLRWAFQWDFALEPGKTFLISKDKLITYVPEPTAIGLLVLGGVLLGIRRGREGTMK